MVKISRFGDLDHPGKCVGNQRRFLSIQKRQKRKGKKSEENTNDKKGKNLMSKQTSFFFLEFDYLEANSHLHSEILC